MEEQMGGLQREVHALRAQLSGAEDTSHVSEMGRKAATDAHSASQSANRQLLDKCEESSREISGLEKQLRRSESGVDQARRECDLLRLQLEQAKSETHEEAALRAEEHRQVESWQGTVEQLRGEISVLQGELGAGRVQLGVAAERESHLSGLMEEIAHCKEEIESHRLKQDRLKEEIRIREDEVVLAGQRVEGVEKRYELLGPSLLITIYGRITLDSIPLGTSSWGRRSKSKTWWYCSWRRGSRP